MDLSRLTPQPLVLLTLVVVVVLGGARLAPAADHPRIFLDADRVKAIRKAIQVDGSTHQLAWKSLKRDVDSGKGWWDPKSKNWNYGRSYLAQAAAFCYLISGEEKYADLAFQTLEDVHKKPDPDRRLPERGYGLSRATVGAGFAVAYDWCYDAWSDKQRQYVMDKIQTALKAWTRFGHANLGDTRGSNWVGVCRGGELIMLIGAGLEDSEQHAKRYRYVKRQMELHIRNGYDGLGVTQEGIGYAGYGGIFVQRAILATRSIGDDDLSKLAAKRDWWKQVMYAGTFSVGAGIRENPTQRIFLMSGVGGPTIGDEGWASLILGTCPREKLPHYVWWYDRHAGVKAPGELENKFDYRREGRIWAMIYYPEDIEAKDPTGEMPTAVSGGAGMCLFRNRWKDADDICGYLTADQHHHGHAWDQPEVLQMNLHAYGTLFFGGPNKTREDKHFTALLVDGKHHRGRGSVGDNGKLEYFKSVAGGAYIVAGGGRQYQAIGAEVKRHLLVDFSGQAAPALLSTLDQVRSDDKRTYTWQGNLGDHNGDWGIEASASKEAGRPVFVLKGQDDSFVKGWVVSPADAEIDAGDPLKISVEGKDADIWVVMVVGQGKAPEATITGSGLASVVKIGKSTVRFDGEKTMRLQSTGVAIDADDEAVGMSEAHGGSDLVSDSGADADEVDDADGSEAVDVSDAVSTTKTELSDEDRAADRLVVAKLYIGMSRKKQAVKALKEVTTKWPETKAADEARTLLSKLGE